MIERIKYKLKTKNRLYELEHETFTIKLNHCFSINSKIENDQNIRLQTRYST